MTAYLIIAPQGLGDCLEATPIVGALARARPGARIDAAVLRPGPKLLFESLDGRVERVLYYPYWESGAAAFAAALLRTLPSLPRYDASFLAYPAARPVYHLLSRLHNAARRFSHQYWPGRRGGQWMETDLIPVSAKHTVLRNLDLVRAAGVDASDEDARYLVPDDWRGDARVGGRIAIHIGTVTHHGLSAKRWPVERFIDLARRLAKRSFEVCVISGPEERAESDAVIDAVASARLVAGPIDAIARFLGTCSAAVTNDSGIGHLAAAVGTRVLALHGPTPVEGGPFGPSAVRFRPSLCPPCFDPRLRNTECALRIDYACLKQDLIVDAVERELDALLAAVAPAATR